MTLSKMHNDFGALPLPVWGEGWGEGLRNYRETFPPHPRPPSTAKIPLGAGDDHEQTTPTDGLNFFRSIVTFSRCSRPEFALRRPLEFRTVRSDGDLHVG